MIVMTDAEKLARLVIMFHEGGRWTAARRELWREFTGTDEATTVVLTDFARLVLRQEETRNDQQRPHD